MTLGKYYCDYCDKQFQDTVFARKRHLQGVQHQRAKALWYDSLRANPNHSYQDSFGKGVCNRFLTTGSCPYGNSCKYLHPKQNPQTMNTSSTTVTNFVDNHQSVNIMSSQLAGGGASLQGNVLRDGSGVFLGNLPPSLKPPPEGGYLLLPFVDWG